MAEFLKFDTSEWFCESICYHVVGRAVDNGNMALRDCLTNGMKMNVDMFGASVKSGILGKMDRNLIITE